MTAISDQNREAARLQDGTFGEQAHTAPELYLNLDIRPGYVRDLIWEIYVEDDRLDDDALSFPDPSQPNQAHLSIGEGTLVIEGEEEGGYAYTEYAGGEDGPLADLIEQGGDTDSPEQLIKDFIETQLAAMEGASA